jgi:hypothetical protein
MSSLFPRGGIFCGNYHLSASQGGSEGELSLLVENAKK